MMDEDKEWKLSRAEAYAYADKLNALAMSKERRAMLALEIEGCAIVIRRQGDEIERLRALLAAVEGSDQ